VTDVTIAHLSDLHFGGFADLKQIEALEEFLPSLNPTALVVSGDLSQRARHGEFQAAGGAGQSRCRVVEESARTAR
jgi:3',5'-cyclic AMP phosphodiesterase CpdA